MKNFQLRDEDGSYSKTLRHLAKCDLLSLDGWGLVKLTLAQRTDWLEIMEDRHGFKSTLVSGQFLITERHAAFGDPTLTDAIPDRRVHSAQQLKLNGKSMLKGKKRLDI